MQGLSVEHAAQLHRAAAKLIRLARRADGGLGLGPLQTAVLAHLAEAGPLSIQDLAEVEGVAQPTMSRAVTTMATSGLIKRDIDRHDRRRAVVRLTRNGRTAHGRARRHRLELITSAVSGLKAETVEQLVIALGDASQQ